MQLVYKDAHISIDQFASVEIPEFMVLTGVNGTGKSHLLDAISKGKVIITGMEQSHIVLFSYETFKLNNEAAFTAQQLYKERDEAWALFNNQFKISIGTWRNQLGDEYETIKEACDKENKSIWELKRDSLIKYKQRINNLFKGDKIKNKNIAQGIYSLAKRLPYSIDEIERDEFNKKYKPFTFKQDFLPYNLGKLIWDYYVNYDRNRYHKYLNETFGSAHEVVSEEEFFSIYGEKPWEVINQILKRFNTLTYKVDSPEGTDNLASYQLKLQHTEKHDVEIDFTSLSSGERVLMALVASVYKSSSDKHFPDILLLDEVDASLHPSMMKNMLNVIDEIFLRQGVKVILVTHSPTTIALVPEESIFVMNRSGQNRIEKKSKHEALEVLTQGFATIEQGLKLFDEVARSSITIITEGNNTKLIKKALQFYSIDGVEVLLGVEEIAGQHQLKTLFDFFSRTNHENKVVFVWDCDVKIKVQPNNNTYPYILPKNCENTIAKKGIENMFPEELFDEFTKTITMSGGEVKIEFDEKRKKDFEEYILSRNMIDDFKHFSSLAAEIMACPRISVHLVKRIPLVSHTPSDSHIPASSGGVWDCKTAQYN